MDTITGGVAILIPTYEDWEALNLLLRALDSQAALASAPWRVLVVDDGSDIPPPDPLRRHRPKHLAAVELLKLKRNLGHQRAIAVGLCHVVKHLPAQAIVVMDGDGEDDPADLHRLLLALRESGGSTCVFAERKRRSEDLVFRLGYAAYRLLHRLLTGIPVQFGNFSAIPHAQAERLVTVSDLWNHYAAAVVKARLPMTLVPTRRARRLAGRTRMNYGALIAHGLSAMSVFSDRVAVRLLVASVFAGAGIVGLLLAVVAIRLLTPLAVPGWATSAVGVLLLLLVQIALVNLIFVFVVLSGRGASDFLPARDYAHFVGGITSLCPTTPEQPATATKATNSTSSP